MVHTFWWTVRTFGCKCKFLSFLGILNQGLSWIIWIFKIHFKWYWLRLSVTEHTLTTTLFLVFLLYVCVCVYIYLCVYIYIYIYIHTRLPGSPDGKESACNMADLGSIPGLGRSPGEGNSYPLQYSYLENSMDRGAWQVTVHGVAKIYIYIYIYILYISSPSIILQVWKHCEYHGWDKYTQEMLTRKENAWVRRWMNV